LDIYNSNLSNHSDYDFYFSPSGINYVLGSNGRFQMIDLHGNPLNDPQAILNNNIPRSICAIGDSLVAIAFTNSLGFYDLQGQERAFYDSPEGLFGDFIAVDITADSNGLIYAPDPTNHRVLVFSKDGFVAEFGTQGSGLGELQIPSRVAVSNDGIIYVSENGNGRIQVFDQSYNSIQTITYNHLMFRDIFVDEFSNIWVLGKEPNGPVTFEKMNKDGKLIWTFPTESFQYDKLFLGFDNRIYSNKFNSIYVHSPEYYVEVERVIDGEVTIQLPDNVITDFNDGPNAASSILAISFDTTIPNALLIPLTPLQTDQVPLEVEIIFEEFINGLEVNDIISTMSVDSIKLSGSGDTFNALIWPNGNGIYNIFVRENAVEDQAGNANLVSDTIQFELSAPIPNPVFTSLTNSPTEIFPFLFSLEFPHEVFGLDSTDFYVSHAYQRMVLTSDGINFNAEIWPHGNGTYDVSLKKNAVEDLAGNKNLDSDTIQIEFNAELPIATFVYVSDSSTNISPIAVQLDFNHTVSNLEITDFTITNGRIDSLPVLPTDQFTSTEILVTPTTSLGSVRITLKAGAVFDEAYNTNAATSISFAFDGRPLTSTITSSLSGYINVQEVGLQISFLRSVSDFDPEDLNLTNCELVLFSGTGRDYVIRVSSTTLDGEVIIEVKENSAHDDAFGAPNASSQYSYYYDITPPNVVLSSPNDVISTLNTILVDINFDDPVADFIADPVFCLISTDFCFTERDVIIKGASLNRFTTFEPSKYQLEVFPVNERITIKVPPGVGFNPNLMPNVASKELIITYTNGIVGFEDELKDASYRILDSRTLEVSYLGFVEGKILLYDLNGRILLNDRIRNGTNLIQLINLNPGIYILNIETNRTLTRDKIYIEH
jgi:hypothetical protein